MCLVLCAAGAKSRTRLHPSGPPVFDHMHHVGDSQLNPAAPAFLELALGAGAQAGGSSRGPAHTHSTYYQDFAGMKELHTTIQKYRGNEWEQAKNKQKDLVTSAETTIKTADKAKENANQIVAGIQTQKTSAQHHLTDMRRDQAAAEESKTAAVQNLLLAKETVKSSHDNLSSASMRAAIANEQASRAAAEASKSLDQARRNTELSNIALAEAKENSDVAKTTFEMGGVSIEEGKEAQQVAKHAIEDAKKQVVLGNQARNDSSVALGSAREASKEAGNALAEVASAENDEARINLIAAVIEKQQEVDKFLISALRQNRQSLEHLQQQHTAMLDAMSAQQEAMDATMIALDDTVKAQKQHGETLQWVLLGVRNASIAQGEVITAQKAHLSALDGILKSQEATSTAIDEAMQDAVQSSKNEMDVVRDDIIQASQQIANFEQLLEDKHAAYDETTKRAADIRASLDSSTTQKTASAVFAVSVLRLWLEL